MEKVESSRETLSRMLGEKDVEIDQLRTGEDATRDVLGNIWAQAVRGLADAAIISAETIVTPNQVLALVTQLADETRKIRDELGRRVDHGKALRKLEISSAGEIATLRSRLIEQER